MGSVPSVSSFKVFLFSYRYEGAEWNVEIPAQSWEDAKRRVSALTSARCEGEVIVRMSPAFGRLARITSSIQNACRKISRFA